MYLNTLNFSHKYYRHTQSLQTCVWRPWLFVSVNLGYQFNVHASLPL